MTGWEHWVVEPGVVAVSKGGYTTRLSLATVERDLRRIAHGPSSVVWHNMIRFDESMLDSLARDLKAAS